MQDSNERAVDILNGLIETTLDSANGYKDAAEAVENPQFRTLFAERAAERTQLSMRLQQEVRTFGGDPERDQSMLGKAHNKFTELKGKLMGSSDKAVVDEVERGEDVIKAKFEKAASSADLPEPARQAVQSAYAVIRADHDHISQLKHSFH